MLHTVFFWGGDILHDYAFAGLVFLGWIFLFQINRLKKFNNLKTFLKIALIWLSVPVVVSTFAALGFGVIFDHGKLTKQWQQQNEISVLVATRMDSPTIEVENTAPDETFLEVEDSGPNSEAEGYDQAPSAVEPSEATSEVEGTDVELSEEEKIEQAVDEIVERKRKQQEDEKEEVAALTQDSYWETTKLRFHFALKMLIRTPVFTVVMLLPIFLVGFWFISSGTLRDHREKPHIFKSMALLGMSFGLFLTIGGLMISEHPVANVSTVLRATGGILFYIGQYVLCAGYLGTIVTLLASPAWLRRPSRFGPMGKMALTNYIMRSIIL